MIPPGPHVRRDEPVRAKDFAESLEEFEKVGSVVDRNGVAPDAL